ncbi:hypothetical protein [Collinsella ihumii]|uniref:hypothetical protein n=1 Tax=Collinsella ihumii TaxID=1720204 RepID=UPI0025AB4D58|nr:hypothetical protein [Collinsella ihumii]MDN0056354.1 hypothetical protein [Collinsella ihumii]
MTKEQAAGAEAAEQGQQETQQQQPNGSPVAAVPVPGAPEWEALVSERDARIAELEASIAEAARTAESAEKLRAEIDELRRAGDEQRIGFELQIAGARNVKAARVLLEDHDGDVEKLKAAEPWLFESGSAGAAPAPAGKTGLPAAGASDDSSAQLKRWRKIAGLDEE